MKLYCCFQVLVHNILQLFEIDAKKLLYNRQRPLFPLLPELSTQFYEDLRKIVELRALAQDIDLRKVEIDDEPEQCSLGRFLPYKDIVSLMRVDFWERLRLSYAKLWITKLASSIKKRICTLLVLLKRLEKKEAIKPQCMLRRPQLKLVLLMDRCHSKYQPRFVSLFLSRISIRIFAHS